ncbi:MAG TPA: four helix bundle protein [Elusimicrobia bacterium]|nr:four helix bundle protein [Elusimicrobiota bacterium]
MAGLYKGLKVWENSVNLIKNIYSVAEKLPKSEEYNLKQQLKRAVVSVALNIAEGKGRKSAKEFSNFLNISFGSLCEVEAILTLCQELNYLSNLEDTFSRIEVLLKMLSSLKNSLAEKQS